MAKSVEVTAETAHRSLEIACQRAGLDAAGAELIRLGSNAVFRLTTKVIVRIARDSGMFDNARKQVAVAGWLEDERYPATKALQITQPLNIEGHAVTFWQSASERVEYAPLEQVAKLIRWLHLLDAPPWLELPTKHPFVDLESRITDLEEIVDATDAAFVRQRVGELRAQYEALRFPLPSGPIHGDANVGNVILDRDEQPLLIDLDSFCIGPREWDLVQTALFYERFGWHTEEEYRTFVEVYGFDIMTWSGYPTLADYREIAMTLWLCGKAGTDDEAAIEVRKRIAAIRSGGDRRDWSPF